MQSRFFKIKAAFLFKAINWNDFGYCKFLPKKTYNYEKLTLHYCRYPGNWLGIRIFCVSYRRKYNTRIISYSNYCIAFGRY